MTDIQVPIAFGKVNATAISTTRLEADTLILNPDLVNSVWVSPESSMQPGYGIELGPKASTNWAVDQPCYAILDRAATAGVMLYVTQSLSNINDPVAIGAAVATELLASGVPSVLKQDLLIDLGGGGFLFNSSGVLNNIGQYASLIVQCGGSFNSVVQLDYHQETPLQSLFYTIREWFTNIDGGNMMAAWQVPVNAQALQFTNTGQNSANLVVYGSNRPVTNTALLSGQALPRRLIFNGVVTAGVSQRFVAADAQSLNSTTFDRTVFIRAASASVAANIGYQYTRANGTVDQIVVATVPAGGSLFQTVAQPIVPVYWFVTPTTTTTTATVFTLDFTEAT